MVWYKTIERVIKVEWDRICLNCNYFIQDKEDIGTGYLGICTKNDVFEDFIEEVLEYEDFSCCYDLYLKNRFDGESEVCDQYEEAEFFELDDDVDIEGFFLREKMKYQNVDGIIECFYDSDIENVRKAIFTISPYVYLGNENAYRGLLSYYTSLGPAEKLEDVHTRLEIIDILTSQESKKETIHAYINELERSPSNNTTRQLYTKILKRLSRLPLEEVEEPLLELLDKKTFSTKIKARIIEVATIRESFEDWYL